MTNCWGLFTTVFFVGSWGMLYIIMKFIHNFKKISITQNPPWLMVIIGIFWLAISIKFWMSNWYGTPKNVYDYIIAALTSVVFGEGGIFLLIGGFVLLLRK
jgi:hypothetical protein